MGFGWDGCWIVFGFMVKCKVIFVLKRKRELGREEGFFLVILIRWVLGLGLGGVFYERLGIG